MYKPPLRSCLDLPQEFRHESENESMLWKPEISKCGIEVFLKKQPECLHLLNTFTFHLLGCGIFWAWQHGGGFCAEFCPVLAFTEGTPGEADWDGEDSDSSRECHQQTSTQHSLYWGKHDTWLISEVSSLCVCHNTYYISGGGSYFGHEKPPACEAWGIGLTQNRQVSPRRGRK